MANHHSPPPPMMQMQQHQAQVIPPQAMAHGQYTPSQTIASQNEAVWLQIGSFSELLRVPDEAMHAYERALAANQQSTQAMNAIGMLLKGREAFDKALEFFRAITQIEGNNGEAWGNLGKLPSPTFGWRN
jgi:glucose repression mediator protein